MAYCKQSSPFRHDRHQYNLHFTWACLLRTWTLFWTWNEADCQSCVHKSIATYDILCCGEWHCSLGMKKMVTNQCTDDVVNWFWASIWGHFQHGSYEALKLYSLTSHGSSIIIQVWQKWITMNNLLRIRLAMQMVYMWTSMNNNIQIKSRLWCQGEWEARDIPACLLTSWH